MMRISSPLTRFIFLCALLWGLSTQAQTKDPAAILQLDTTTQGLLPPRMTTAQRDAIDSPPDGLMIYNTTTGSIEFYKGASSEWEATNTEPEYLPLIIHNNLVYVPLISKGTGEIWLDRNIGATQAPTSINDTGDVFSDFFIRSDAFAAGVCPPGYRLPTKAEWQAELDTFASNGGRNHTGAFNTLKLTVVGYRAGSGSSATGTGQVFYFSSAGSGGDDDNGAIVVIPTNAYITAVLNNTSAFCVRCIKDD